jgi:hypothetical protein
VGGALAQGAAYQCERERLGLERLDDPASQAVTYPRHERLCARIDPQARSIQGRATLATKIGGGYQFPQYRRIDPDRQVRIAARNGVADPIRLFFVEENDLVGFRHGCGVADMAHINPPVGEHEMGVRSALLGALVPARAGTLDVPHRQCVGNEERVVGQDAHVRKTCCRPMTLIQPGCTGGRTPRLSLPAIRSAVH